MLKTISLNNTTEQTFCQKYWQNILTNTKKIPITADLFDFGDASLELMGLTNLYSHMGDLSYLIRQNDLVQNFDSKLTDKDMVLWRGIQGFDEGLHDEKTNYVKKLFNKCVNLKKGDIFHMPEYSFWSDEKDIASRYAGVKIAKQALIYELSLPKGSEVYQKRHYIFRRYSKFLCTDNKKVIEGNTTYNHIKLELLPRDIFYHIPR